VIKLKGLDVGFDSRRKERPEKEANIVDSLKNLVGASRK
jgi:hypothetical protein